MLCDYLKLNKTDMNLYVVGAEGMQYCRANHKDIADIYSKYLTWIFEGLDGEDKNELAKIFKVGKQYTDAGRMEAFLKFFIAQLCGLGRYVAKKQNKPHLIEQNFSVFEEFGKSIKENVVTELVFNVGDK